ncbi:MAG: hypothetical protein V3U24_09795 [Candidatus Neomarinimicrobiota bacterium]
MTKKGIALTFCILLVKSLLFGQSVTLDGTFYRFITYYVSSVDINTGSSDVQLFRYRLASDSYPISVTVEFEITIQSAALGIPDPTTLIEVAADIPEMTAHIDLDNRDLSTENLVLYDVEGNEVEVDIDVEKSLEMEDLDDLFSVIVQTGRLPEGVYAFRLSVFSEDGGLLATVEQILNVTPSRTLQLTSPGGGFEELAENEIYTTYPVFQWESEMFSAPHIRNCPECGFFLRVAEFVFEEHATVEDAIEDVTALPLDQAMGWQLVSEASGNQLSFMYPTAGVVDLMAGSIYVWQIQKRISTTEGIERINSPIYAFMIKDMTVNPIMQALQEILPEEILQAYFTPGGPLTGYQASGTFTLDGTESDMSTLNALVEEFRQGTASLISTEVR